MAQGQRAGLITLRSYDRNVLPVSRGTIGSPLTPPLHPHLHPPLHPPLHPHLHPHLHHKQGVIGDSMSPTFKPAWRRGSAQGS